MQKEPESALVKEKLRELRRMIHKCQEKRNRSEHNLALIAKTHERLQKELKVTASFRTKLQGLYNAAMQDADAEVDMLKNTLSTIHEIRTIRNERRLASKNLGHPEETIRQSVLMVMVEHWGMTLPLWVGKPNESPPPLCGAIPAESNHIAKVGDMVAASVKNANAEDYVWILAEVTYYNSSTKKYEIDDIDEEQGDKHIVSRSHVIPLPLMRANPETNPEALFPKGALVLALYPRSTCFYAGLVYEPPSKPNEQYKVRFEDSRYEGGYSPPLNVCQGYVINFKEGRKK